MRWKPYVANIQVDPESYPKTWTRVRAGKDGRRAHWRKHKREVQGGQTIVDILIQGVASGRDEMKKRMWENLYGE